MKIYAIRDRLIDYFMQPFVGHDNKGVLAAVARTVNQEGTSDISQAPHHFEIWQLGEVDEHGHLTAKLDFIADCSSLVRRGVRETGHPGTQEAQATTEGSRRAPAGGNRAADPNPRPLPNAPPGATGEAEEVPRGPRGGYPPRGE